MKRIKLLFTTFFLASTMVMAQENLVTLTGGYAWSKLDVSEIKASGYRINLLYEFNPREGTLSHGLSVGYLSTDADSVGAQGAQYRMSSWPIYYALKAIFGGSNLKLFVKGAIGIHFSSDKRTSTALEVKTNQEGFYGGIGVGVMYFLKQSIFLDLDYEWAYMGNSIYKNGFINTANAGLGIKF